MTADSIRSDKITIIIEEKETAIDIPESRIKEYALSIILLIAGLFLVLTSYNTISLNFTHLAVKISGYSLMGFGLIGFVITSLNSCDDARQLFLATKPFEDEMIQKQQERELFLKYQGFIQRIFDFVNKNPQVKSAVKSELDQESYDRWNAVLKTQVKETESLESLASKAREAFECFLDIKQFIGGKKFENSELIKIISTFS